MTLCMGTIPTKKSLSPENWFGDHHYFFPDIVLLEFSTKFHTTYHDCIIFRNSQFASNPFRSTVCLRMRILESRVHDTNSSTRFSMSSTFEFTIIVNS
jgi:hypothetical protein